MPHVVCQQQGDVHQFEPYFVVFYSSVSMSTTVSLLD